jgi:competence protein ComEA
MSVVQERVKSALHQLRHWIVFLGVRRVVSGVVSMAVVAVVGWWLLRAPAPPVESQIVRVTTTSISQVVSETSSPTLASRITVHVAGAVQKPGVYELSPQARVVDAIDAAGGATNGADLNAINLALPLVDSEQIFVPRKGEKIIHPRSSPRSSSEVQQPSSSGSGNTQSGLVNINTASAKELEALPGVGPSTAKAIITYRTTVAPFSSLDDLLQVSGIGPAKLEAMRGFITV